MKVQAEPAEQDVPEIVAGAVQLRPWSLADAPEILPAMDDPDISIWNPSVGRNGPGIAGARAWLEHRMSGQRVSWAIRDATGGVLLGQVTLSSIDDEHRDAEIGYWLLAPARGRGVGTTAVQAVARYAFDALDLLRLTLFHAVENTASCALATRAGFAYEGTHRQSHRYGDGRWHDEHSHARLATDPLSTAPAS